VRFGQPLNYNFSEFSNVRNDNLKVTLDIIESPRVKAPLSTNRRFIIAAVSLILGTVLFAIAYIGMRQQIGLGALNQPVLDWMMGHREANLTGFAKLVTSVANPRFFIIFVSLCAIIWAFAKREVWRPLMLTGAMGIMATTSMVMKSLTKDLRPPQVNMVPAFELDYSFPSGHTIGIIVLLLVFGYLIYSRHYSVGRFISWIGLASIGTALMALSRLYLGYHWLTDVIASVGLGFIILAIIIVIDTIVVRKINLKQLFKILSRK